MVNNNNKKQYRLIFYEEKTLNEIFNISLTSTRMFLFFVGLFFFLGFLIALLLIYTPLSNLLPPVENIKLTEQIIKTSKMVDSLKTEIIKRDFYTQNILQVLSNQNIYEYSKIDSTQLKNILTPQQRDSLIRELKKIESKIQSKPISFELEKNYNFRTPLKGLITQEFDINSGHLGIDIVSVEGYPILAIDDGTVISTYWSNEWGNVIIIQHPKNAISIYKHCKKLLKKEVDIVRAEEPIAEVGGKGVESKGVHLHFELWLNGIPVNPRNFILFE